jgi:hypothetical protein
MSAWLIEAKSEILRASSLLELHAATENLCHLGRYTYDEQMSYSENAELALLQSKPAVAECLQLAHKRSKCYAAQ